MLFIVSEQFRNLDDAKAAYSRYNQQPQLCSYSRRIQQQPWLVLLPIPKIGLFQQSKNSDTIRRTHVDLTVGNSWRDKFVAGSKLVAPGGCLITVI